MTEYFTKDGDEFKKVDANLLTQSDVDNVIEERLKRERTKFADYDTLKEKAGKVDTITQEFTEKLKGAGDAQAELETKLKKAVLETDKVKIVHEFKLSNDLAEFVTGDTPDELRARAEKLAKGVVGVKIPAGKEQKPEDKPSETKAIAKELFGKKSD